MPADEDKGTSKLSVLLVDDEPEVLEVTRRFLEQEGEMAVTTAGSAEEALSLIPDRWFDAIVSDYKMKEIDGIELLKEVRKGLSGGASYPVHDPVFIIFTGRGSEDTVIEAMNHGADRYLRKGSSDALVNVKSAVVDAVRRRGQFRYPGRTGTVPEELAGADEPLIRRLSGGSEGAMILSPAGTVLFMNDAAATTLGLPSPGSRIGRPIRDLIPDASYDLVLLKRVPTGMIADYRLPGDAGQKRATVRLTWTTFPQDAVLLEFLP